MDNVLFSPTGHRLIVVGSNEGSVYVYKTVNDDIGDKIAEIEQRTRTFNGSLKIAISSDSEILVIGANNGDIKVIDLITGLEKFQFFHSGGVRSLALSANGQWLVTGSRFNIDSPATVRIWETKTGRLLLEFEGSASEIVFGLDDKLLVTFDWGQNVNVQSWQLEDLIVETCTRIPRNFTTDEWKEYFGDKPYHRTCSNLSQPAK
ncbi:MAG: hypothetical protein B6242_13990 [Anaerolineaceae bacterium 4572_78]|nr:MAG: hypothetical protein B6242_13990 [Anaerolineaceae bacterium 4572_78]